MYTKDLNLIDCVHVYLAFAAQSHCRVLWDFQPTCN